MSHFISVQTGKLHPTGIAETLRTIWQSEGLPGMFRGNGASVLRIIPYSSIHFGLYEHYRRLLVEATYGRHMHAGVSPGIDLLAGAGAGATAVLVTYPLDLVRTRIAYMMEAGPRGGQGQKPSLAAALRGRHTIGGVLMTTLRGEGLRGLYHGIGPSMYGILPYAGLKFFVYQHLKQFYLAAGGGAALAEGGDGVAVVGQPRLPVPAMLTFGGIAGIVAQTTTYPLDVVRRRMQVEGLKYRQPPVALGAPHFPDGKLPQSTPAALVAIARREGWRVLYAGLSINYMKVVPSTAIGFTLYDYLKSALDLPTHL